MIEINKSQEVTAPVEKVWKLVSDSRMSKSTWTVLRNVKILSKKDNSTVEREATIRRGPMDRQKVCRLFLSIPVKIETLTMTDGPMLGTRKIVLNSVDEKKTKIEVSGNSN